MKIIAVFSAIVCTFAVMGLDSMSTDFTNQKSAKAWILDGSPKNMPALKYGYDAEKKVFAINNAETKQACFKNPSQRLDAKKGDVIHVSIEACGQGQLFLNYECFNDAKWTGMGIRSKTMQLKDGWTKFEADFVIKDLKLPTTKVMLDFYVMPSGKVMIRSYSAAKAAK